MEPATGKLGVMCVGLGAVTTTFMTGVLMTRKGLAKPVGSMTQYDKIRVGRGADRSYCVLVTKEELSETTRRRLQVMVDTNDGFRIAEEDMRLRGPGDFLGVRQSGVPGLHLSSFGTDLSMLNDAQDAAQMTNISDPELEGYPELRAYVERMLKNAAQAS